MCTGPNPLRLIRVILQYLDKAVQHLPQTKAQKHRQESQMLSMPFCQRQHRHKRQKVILQKKIVTTNPIPRTTKKSNKNTDRFTSKLISNTRTTTPSGERTSTSVLNGKLSHPHSRFSIPGYFQFIEVGLIAITTIVAMGLLGCCCLRFCGGKRSEDDDEDEKEKEAKSIQPAWKENHRSPISKPNRWTDDF